ncbi:YigZ family protein [Roseburia hominis]
MKNYKTIYREGQDEVVEKKSRFIAVVRPVHSEEEAAAFLEEMRKTYWNARHHCYAYVFGDHSQMQRCSDDGEPQGTAGKPMLDVLNAEGLHDTMVVVTRYFGGTLLGTGGLVRAYQKAAKAGIAASTVIEKCRGKKLTIRTDYTGLGKIQYILGQRGIHVLDTIYTDAVEIQIMASVEEEQELTVEITEGTNGQAHIEAGELCYFAVAEGEVLLFDE